ncbi:flagellar biosynthesis anti-sigma factor FlgM [Paenibacillus xerothermodurans]|uniref:Negative regulator of flagellin synthesis n=1 Tax=Paenibacillus xerothermodurans TaxID=1977292 RepID=A0A2W1N6C9_PAEXE|nr:flagellar biosynthesis anti-sigma factor FlgM [Paenibacillus xerothermodurans]PZE19364.1 flagellar biosynthesis anti-sigma factor FlgM [Paenibacillus xerothermodurans]
MKINGTNPIGATNPYKKSLDTMPNSAAGKTGKKKDQVEISEEAKELLNSHNLTATEQRRQKIDELRSAVASGTYNVDARRIAEKLLPFIN